MLFGEGEDAPSPDVVFASMFFTAAVSAIVALLRLFVLCSQFFVFFHEQQS
jgi:hypothetical protein